VSDEDEAAIREVYEQTTAQAVARSKAEITRFFDGLELTDHGLTRVGDWGSPTARATALGYADVARKAPKTFGTGTLRGT
jgi:S-adenosyl methyltransferase